MPWLSLTPKVPITTAADNKFCVIFPDFQKVRSCFIRIVCKQTILMKYHVLFVIVEKALKFDCRLLQIMGGALWV